MKRKGLSLLLAAILLMSLSLGAVPAQAAQEAAPAVTDPGEPVRMIVELEEPKAFPLSLFAPTPSREDVKDAICELVETASPLSAEGEAAPKVTFGYDYSVLLQGFSLTAPEGYLDEIRALGGVRNAFVAQTYTLVEPEGGWANADSQAVVGALDAHKRGCTGEGQVIAVLDTMLLPEHEAFSGTVPNPKLSKADVAEKLPSLTVAEEASADALWRSDKIPFCFDYYDHDADVTSENPHGTHVSGIAAANGGEIIGVAPDAQLLYMKVFNWDDSSDEDAILAALEDAVVLGADCVNMSLGMPGGFAAYPNETTQRVYENLRAADVTLCCSAGNEGPFGVLGWPTPVTMPDGSTVGSPASYDAALAVANMTMRSYECIHAGGQDYYAVDGANGSDGTIPPLSTLGETELDAVDCGDGSGEYPAEAAGAAVFLDLRDYWGGYSQLYLRAQESGARLIVFCLDDTWQYASGFAVEDGKVPLVFCSYDAARAILDGQKRISVDGARVTAYPPDNSTSWGPAPELKLKPEIAAIGAQVYSSVAGSTDAYERMSGTSMSSPQAAGELILLRQYLKEKNYDTPLTLTQLAETLLMCSAEPVTDPINGGGFISPLRQGAGMGNIVSAMDAKAWISVPGSERPKAELGAGEGPFTFSFTVHNLTSEPLTYRSEVLALAQDMADGRFQLTSTNYAGKGVDVQIRDVISVPAGGEQTITVTLTVTDAFREAVAAAENGVFLDGFVRLYAEDGSGSDLGLPYLAFVGDWEAAPLLDLEGAHAAPRLVSFTDTELGTNPAELVETVDEYGNVHTAPYVDPDAASISPTGEYLFSGFRSRTVLLRPAAWVSAVMTNEDGEIVEQHEQKSVRRSCLTGDGDFQEFMENQLDAQGSFYAFDDEGDWLPEGWYTYTVTARLAGGEKEESWSRRIYCDWTQPEMQYEISGEQGRRTLSLTVSDNFKLSYFTVAAPATWVLSPDAFVVTDLGLEQGRYDSLPYVKSLTKADGVYTLELDLEAFLQHLNGLGLRTDVLQLEAKDYADNTASELITLSEDYYPLSITIDQPEIYLALGETTQLHAVLQPEDCPHDKVTWESMDPSVATVDENGFVTAVGEGWTQIYAHGEVPEGTFPLTGTCDVNVRRFEPQGYQITFDPMGGTCPVPALYTIEAEGLPYTLLSYPPAEREGYTFLGWFLEPEGGEPLEPLYLFEGDTTLYAHWAKDGEQEGCDGGDNCPSKAFVDVERGADSWYHEPVDWAVVNGVTTGVTDTAFMPKRICTRAQAVTFLWRASGCPEPETTESPLKDITDPNLYYYKAVLWAFENGITTGYADGTFRPNGECTRAHIVAFLFRAKNAEPVEGAENPFVDVPEDAWFADSALWAVQQGITTGDGSEETFHPNAGCSRAMIVTFLYRAQ